MEWAKALVALDTIVVDPEVVSDTAGILFKQREDVAALTRDMAVQLLQRRIEMPQAQRWGGLLLAGLLFTLGMERAWDHPVVWDSSNDRSLVQAAHLSGAVWGLCLGGLARWLPTVRRRARAPSPPAPPDETVHP